MMAAPVLLAGASERKVYFPKGADWKHHYTGDVYKGGSTEMVPAPLENFPLFHRVASV
jgi:alpha-D-xyloside xylohydrolase